MHQRSSSLMSRLFAGVLLLGLCLTSNPLRAEVLDQMVTEALDHNPDLAAAKARWQQFSYKSPQVGSLQDPILSFAFSSYPVDSLSSTDTAMTGNELKLSQMFPYPGKLENKAALADEQARWFEAVYQDMHFQLARKVKDAWYRLYFNNQAIAVTERNLKLVDDIIRLTEVRYETGSGLQQDVLKAQVQRSRLMEKLLAMRQQGSVLAFELNRLLNRTSAEAYPVPENLELPSLDKDLATFQEAALKLRPMSAAYDSLVKRYHYQQKLARLDDYPDATLWASWRFRDDGLGDGGTDFVSAGVSVNLPVYRERRRAEKAEADAAVRMAERQADDFKSGLNQSISSAFARMEETRQQATLYREGIIPQTSQSFQAALSAYQVGSVAFISLLDSLMTTYQAEMEYYRISSEYMRSLAWLEAESTLPVIGEPLQIENPIINGAAE